MVHSLTLRCTDDVCKTSTMCWYCVTLYLQDIYSVLMLYIRRYLHRLSSTTLKYTETSWCKTPGWVTSTPRTGASGRTDCSYSSSGASPGRSWYYLTTAYLWQLIGMLLRRTWAFSKRYTITYHMRLGERLIVEAEDIDLPYPAATDNTLARVCPSGSQLIDTLNYEFIMSIHFALHSCFHHYLDFKQY